MILAFFNVVASRQISPHVLFRAANIDIFFHMQVLLLQIINLLIRGLKKRLKFPTIIKIYYLRVIKTY